MDRLSAVGHHAVHRPHVRLVQRLVDLPQLAHDVPRRPCGPRALQLRAARGRWPHSLQRRRHFQVERHRDAGQLRSARVERRERRPIHVALPIAQLLHDAGDIVLHHDRSLPHVRGLCSACHPAVHPGDQSLVADASDGPAAPLRALRRRRDARPRPPDLRARAEAREPPAPGQLHARPRAGGHLVPGPHGRHGPGALPPLHGPGARLGGLLHRPHAGAGPQRAPARQQRHGRAGAALPQPLPRPQRPGGAPHRHLRGGRQRPAVGHGGRGRRAGGSRRAVPGPGRGRPPGVPGQRQHHALRHGPGRRHQPHLHQRGPPQRQLRREPPAPGQRGLRGAAPDAVGGPRLAAGRPAARGEPGL
mmetsp:Transcript_62568/g.201773  ORF Transcript_62568/g.201773 Transcript_62568/m.201773 type:complete len:361 (+) Transcript_62568:225-1307(+)